MGLLNNCQIDNLKKILTLIKGQTCMIFKPRNNFSMKTAFIMVDKNDFVNKVRKLSALTTNLFIIPIKDSCKICIQCRSILHIYKDCDAPHILDKNN